jgi:murein DD-endopeptidase MepM/ murein hydrolase activator NlpD
MWLQLYAALLLVWPVPNPQVERAYEPPPAPWMAGHRGVDLAGKPGQPVRAVGPGRVSFAGTVAGRGVVSIELSGTGSPPLRTTYEPVRPAVSVGERVTEGQRVATLRADPSHCRPAVCLHWGLRRGDAYLNPVSLLRREPSILLPVLDIPLPQKADEVQPTSADSSPPAAGPLAAALTLAAATTWAHRRLRRR